MDARKKTEGELFELLSLWIKEAKSIPHASIDKMQTISKAINKIVHSINDLTFVDSPPNEDDEDGYLHQYDNDDE